MDIIPQASPPKTKSPDQSLLPGNSALWSTQSEFSAALPRKKAVEEEAASLCFAACFLPFLGCSGERIQPPMETEMLPVFLPPLPIHSHLSAALQERLRKMLFWERSCSCIPAANSLDGQQAHIGTALASALYKPCHHRKMLLSMEELCVAGPQVKSDAFAGSAWGIRHHTT